MSRIVPTFLLVLALAAPVAAMPPGTLALGLPLLFGSDTVPATGPTSTPRDAEPIIDLKLPSDLDEAQEHREPPTRAEQARECLKVWRQLVADGKFDIAPLVAAKALKLDPTSREARSAVIASKALRGIECGSCCDHTETAPARPAPKTEEEQIVQTTLKHLFPTGLLTGCTNEAKITATTATTRCSCTSKREAPKAQDAATIESPAKAPLMFGAGINCDAGLVCTVSMQSKEPAKRVTIKTAAWQFECDRASTLSEREMILDGNVTMTMHGRDVTVQAARVRVNMIDGSVQVEGK